MNSSMDAGFITGIGSVNDRMLILMDIEALDVQRRHGADRADALIVADDKRERTRHLPKEPPVHLMSTRPMKVSTRLAIGFGVATALVWASHCSELSRCVAWPRT